MRMDRIVRRPVDVATLLIRAIARHAEDAGCGGTTTALGSQDWASATFTGTRHAIRHAAPDTPARTGWIAALAEAELGLRGHLLADVVVTHADADGVAIAALTLVAD